MKARQAIAPLDLGELLRVDPLARADAVHVADSGRRVDQVILAETFERLRRTTPHALVVLHHEAASGGWSLAAALHVAWERNASGVVVPRSAMSSSSAVLAERLSIALLVIDDDPVDVALALAGQVSAPQAVRASRLALCAERLAEQSSIRGVLGVLNAELAPVPVALVIGGSVAAGRAAALRGTERVRIEINGSAGRPWAELVAAVRADEITGHVESVLRLARLPLLAVWAQARLTTSTRAAQEQAAFQLLRRMASEPGDSVTTDADIEAPSWTTELGWRVDGVNRAVWIAQVNGSEPGPELTALVCAAWQRHRPDWPILADGDGWISWRNAGTEEDENDSAAMRRALAPVTKAARTHGLALGVGGAHAGIPGLMRSVTEARLAAQVARDGGAGATEWFDQVGARAALAWLPQSHIAAVADLCLPDLMTARDRQALVDTVLAVLDCGGSLSQASARLGVHRNTVLARVARARELGLALDDPTQRLALHVLCHALAADRS